MRERKRKCACAQEWVSGTPDLALVKREMKEPQSTAQLWESLEQADGKCRAKLAHWRSPASGRNGPVRALTEFSQWLGKLRQMVALAWTLRRVLKVHQGEVSVTSFLVAASPGEKSEWHLSGTPLLTWSTT